MALFRKDTLEVKILNEARLLDSTEAYLECSSSTHEALVRYSDKTQTIPPLYTPPTTQQLPHFIGFPLHITEDVASPKIIIQPKGSSVEVQQEFYE